MKKITIALALATFVFTSCSEAKKETASETESHDGHAHEGGHAQADLPPAGKIVVEAPDFTAGAEAVKPQVAQLLTSYLALQEKLADDDAPGAQAQAQAILEAAAQVKTTALSADEQTFTNEKLGEIRGSAGKIKSSADLQQQRANLELLSEATFALTKAFGATSQKLFYQHCPMANNNQGAYWLSASQEVRNPYFGKEMLGCGSNEEVFN